MEQSHSVDLYLCCKTRTKFKQLYVYLGSGGNHVQSGHHRNFLDMSKLTKLQIRDPIHDILLCQVYVKYTVDVSIK